MYTVNNDLSIYVTRGDAVLLAVGANNNGVPYVFQPGEVVRFRVFEKKGCHCTVLQKDFIITDAVESVEIVLTKNETKIGEIVSKPKDYWYEIELNPDYNPQTIVGYDDDGPKLFRLFPEGADTEGGEGEAPDNYVPAIGGYLPYVTEADNGKTMAVVDGEWQLAAGDLPNPSDVPFDGCAVVTKGGKWGLSDTPVATMADLSSVNGHIDYVDTFATETRKVADSASNKATLAQFAAAQVGARFDGMGIVNVRDMGAVGDGVADDTDAIQSALDQGGIIYFPAGRYKTTRTLTAIKPCCIKMFKPYPGTWLDEYPKTAEDNWMGSRIETYATDIGMVIGDSVEVDGLFIRAMTGFGRHDGAGMASGVVLKVDTTLGKYCYQAGVRLSHIKLETDCSIGYPESMFDFTPDGSYHYILDDIAIGRSPTHPKCGYGFRADLSGTPRKWCNNVFIRNMCIDLWADVAMYIDGASCATGWVFDGLTIQAYPKAEHKSLMVLKNMKDTLFSGSYLWDTGGVPFSEGIIQLEDVSYTTCVGCSSDFDAIETRLSEKMKQPENLNIANLQMSVKGDEEVGGNALTLSDGTHKQTVVIPAVTPSDEQIDTSITKWMDENAAPKLKVGRNKFDASSEDNVVGYFYWSTGYAGSTVYHDKSDTMWTTHYIEAKKGDIVRMSKGGTLLQGYGMLHYDKDKNFLGSMGIAAGNSGGQDYRQPQVGYYTGDNENIGEYEDTAYIRIYFDEMFGGKLADIAESQICITINTADTSYAPYETSWEGGIGSFIKLQSPNGKNYTLSVTDDGQLIAVPDKLPYTNLADPTSEDWHNDAALKYISGEEKWYGGTGMHDGRGVVTNFIPIKQYDVFRVKGFDFDSYSNGQYAYFLYYDENKEYISAQSPRTDQLGLVAGLPAGTVPDESGVLTHTILLRGDNGEQFVYQDYCTRAKYVRVSALRNVPENEIIITVNEEIV